MKKKVKICFVGGGSYGWGPGLIRDTICRPEFQEVEFRIYDINLSAAKLIAQVGKKWAGEWNKKARFIPTKDKKRAFLDADFVYIAISTGGLDAMEHDLKIPERYGIFQTVGDTVGPGGWARGLRNIPVFVDLAQTVQHYCPKAVILNYTNPMATLTRTLCENTSQPVVGLCHGLFECYAIFKKIFNLKSEKDIKINFGGVNHFFWILDLKINGEDGYELLRCRLKGRNFDELVRDTYADGAGFHSDKLVAGELFQEYGYLPYIGDRHICEFFSRYLAPDERKLKLYRLHRTSIEERRQSKKRQLKGVKNLFSCKKILEPIPSREMAASISSCIATGGEFIDVVNLPNRGQIPNLPIGAVVETLGVVNSLGFTPLHVGPLPQKILNLVLPHAVNQKWIVDAGVTGDWDTAFKALINDPLCSHLSIPQIKKMGRELLEANRRYLPQFFKGIREKTDRG